MSREKCIMRLLNVYACAEIENSFTLINVSIHSMFSGNKIIQKNNCVSTTNPLFILKHISMLPKVSYCAANKGKGKKVKSHIKMYFYKGFFVIYWIE